MDSFALVFQDRLSQYAADIRRLENRITDLEAEITELKRPKIEKRTETALENLLMKGAIYGRPED
jgi:cell division protein FtsB